MKDARRKVTMKSSDTDPLTRYVHFLLAQMAKGNQQEMTLAQSRPLPDPFVPSAKQLPEGIDYGTVVGQLQAITHGYDPSIEYAADSQCEIRINGASYQLAVHVREVSCVVNLTRG